MFNPDILALLASPQARGLFSAAISLSGSPNITADRSTTSALQRKFLLPLTGCSTLDCLLNQSPKVKGSFSDIYFFSLASLFLIFWHRSITIFVRLQSKLQCLPSFTFQSCRISCNSLSSFTFQSCSQFPVTQNLTAASDALMGPPPSFNPPNVPLGPHGNELIGMVIVDGLIVTKPLLEAVAVPLVDVRLWIQSVQCEMDPTDARVDYLPSCAQFQSWLETYFSQHLWSDAHPMARCAHGVVVFFSFLVWMIAPAARLYELGRLPENFSLKVLPFSFFFSFRWCPAPAPQLPGWAVLSC
jgi:hypothetical protein